jgi:hypothetical protein
MPTRTAISTLAIAVAAACHAPRTAPENAMARTPPAPDRPFERHQPLKVRSVPETPPAPETSPAPAAPTAPTVVEPAHSVRWLPGLTTVAFSDRSAGTSEERLGPPPRDCHSGDTQLRSATADVADAADGAETILASMAHGVVVFTAEGQELARAPIECGGSADELEAIAIGTADTIGPVIAVLVTTGGHAESIRRVDLFRVEGEDTTRLERLFSAPIEVRDGDRLRTGRIELVPGGLVFRRPGGRTTRWTYDLATRALIRVQRPGAGPR